MNKLQLIYKSIREFQEATKCPKSKILFTINPHTMLEAFKQSENVGLDDYLAAILYGDDLKIFGVELKLCRDYEDNFFTVGFKNYL